MILTRNKLAVMAAKQWKEQYQNPANGEFLNTLSGSSQDKFKELSLLGEKPEHGEVDRVIGNNPWTRTKCDSCQVENEPVKVITQKTGDGYILHVCENCLSDFLSEMRGGKQ